jgi:hypothetical protein
MLGRATPEEDGYEGGVTVLWRVAGDTLCIGSSCARAVWLAVNNRSMLKQMLRALNVFLCNLISSVKVLEAFSTRIKLDFYHTMHEGSRAHL